MSITFHHYDKHSLLIQWMDHSQILAEKISLINSLKQRYKNTISINAGAGEILIVFHKEVVFSRIEDEIKTLYADLSKELISSTSWNLPMCTEFADLEFEDLSSHTGLSKKDILDIHYNTTYTVEFIGFLPGFPYLSGLDERLQIPRKKTPSKSIKSGTVAIANTTCGIYPQESPAGWYGIGRCPIQLFDPLSNPPVFLKAGDQVQFYEIDLNRYNGLKKSPIDINELKSHG